VQNALNGSLPTLLQPVSIGECSIQGASGVNVGNAFLGSVSSGGACSSGSVAPMPFGVPSSFAQVTIGFNPKVEEMSAQSMQCESDMAVCNRECERLFGERQVEMEEPCKLAVVEHFMNSSSFCFPSTSTVRESHRGVIRISEVKVGDELVVANGAASRVVALLHNSANAVVLYLRISYGGGELKISPQHLLRVRRQPQKPRVSAPSVNGVDGNPEVDSTRADASTSWPVVPAWQWLPAQNVRAGDELEDCSGSPCMVLETSRVCLTGAYAPLTVDGCLLVDGVLCSCYAPPAAWAVPHSACHATMLPLRVVDTLRATVESWSRPADGMKDPLMTLEVLWLLPRCNDPTVHPYASGLLRCTSVVKALVDQCTDGNSPGLDSFFVRPDPELCRQPIQTSTSEK